MFKIVTTKLFFDGKAVIGAVDKATRKVFMRFGAFVRRGAKSSIRKRRRISDPGSPPSSHVGTLKRLIYFGYDPVQKSVVIGPEMFRGQANAPLLEYGGRTRLRRRARRGRIPMRSGAVIATYKARPFMGPAFEREKPKLPAMWAGSVK